MILSKNPSEWEFKVKNAETKGNEMPSEACIDYYFNTKKILPKTKDICPSCKKTMYRKKFYPNISDEDIMVGGHVASYVLPVLKWILPICKECNDRKLNLPPFKVKLGKLCPLPAE